MIIEILGVVMENLENAILDVGKNAFQKKKQNMEHSDGTLLWKDICRGERSCKEFAEVRNGWI